MTDNEIVDVFHEADRIQRAKSLDEIASKLTTRMKALGFEACLITRLPGRQAVDWHAHILANHWPKDWFERYNSAGHYHHDPCVAECRHSAEPFLWSDIEADELDASARTIMGEAAEFGLREGICVPLHVPLLRPVTVTVAGNTVDTSPVAQQAVHILARNAIFAAMRVVGVRAPATASRLSRRETEVLQWSAAGKSAWAISMILSVSEHTVLTHLKNVKQKLMASNIVDAVVEGLRRREIEL